MDDEHFLYAVHYLTKQGPVTW